MKNFIYLSIISIAVLFGSCKEKENEFQEVQYEVYETLTVEKSGCFSETDLDSTEIASYPTNIFNGTYIENGLGYISYTSNYYRHAQDSVSLVGNVLRIYLKSTTAEEETTCLYQWLIELKIIEDKGMKIIKYEFENGAYVEKDMMYNHVLDTKR